MKLGIGAGHGGNDPGAVSQGNVERDLNRNINSAMVAAARARGATVVDLTVDKGSPYCINEPVAIANSNGVQIAIQNHHNAGGGTGVEVCYWSGDATGQKYAAAISAAIAATCGIPNRGAKARGTELGFLRDTKMTALIIEWGFVDAPGNNDIPKVLANRDKAIQVALDALGLAKPAAPAPAPAPAPKPDPAPTVKYRVAPTNVYSTQQIGAYNDLSTAKGEVDKRKVVTTSYPVKVWEIATGKQVYP